MQQFIDLYRRSFAGLPRRVWYLAAVLLINRAGAMVIAYLTVYLTQERDFTTTRAGLVMAAFGAGGMAGNYLGGYLNDRFGSYHVQWISLLGSGLLFFVLQGVSDFYFLCGTIFLLATVADCFRPANKAATAYYTAPENLHRAFGLLRMAVNLGISMGPMLGAWLIASFGYDFLFYIDGLTCVLSAVLFGLLLPPDETTRPVAETVTAPPPAAPGQSPPPGNVLQPARPFTLGRLFAFCGGNLLIAVAFMQFFTTLPVYLTQLGYEAWHLGALYTFNGLMIVVCEMPLIYLLSQRFSRITLIGIGGGLIGLAHLFLSTTALIGGISLLAFSFIVTLGEILEMPFAGAYITSVSPLSRRGRYLGWLAISFSAGFIIAPIGGFFLIEHLGAEAAYTVIGLLGCAGGGLMYWVGRG